jgi:hypothetical protein
VNSSVSVANCSATSHFTNGAFVAVPPFAPTHICTNTTSVLSMSDAGNIVSKIIPDSILGIFAGSALSLFQSPAFLMSTTILVENSTARAVWLSQSTSSTTTALFDARSLDFTALLVLPQVADNCTITVVVSPPSPPSSLQSLWGVSAVGGTSTSSLAALITLGSVNITNTSVSVSGGSDNAPKPPLTSFLVVVLGDLSIAGSRSVIQFINITARMPSPPSGHAHSQQLVEVPAIAATGGVDLGAALMWSFPFSDSRPSAITCVSEEVERHNTTDAILLRHGDRSGGFLHVEGCTVSGFSVVVPPPPPRSAAALFALWNSSGGSTSKLLHHIVPSRSGHVVSPILSFGCNLWDDAAMPWTAIAGGSADQIDVLRRNADLWYPTTQFNGTLWCNAVPAARRAASRSAAASGAAAIVAAVISIRQFSLSGSGSVHGVQNALALLHLRTLCAIQPDAPDAPAVEFVEDACCDAGSSPTQLRLPLPGVEPYAGAMVGNTVFVVALTALKWASRRALRWYHREPVACKSAMVDASCGVSACGFVQRLLLQLRSLVVAQSGGAADNNHWWATSWSGWSMFLCPTIASGVVLLGSAARSHEDVSSGVVAVVLGAALVGLWMAPWGVTSARVLFQQRPSDEWVADEGPPCTAICFCGLTTFPFHAVPTRRVVIKSKWQRTLRYWLEPTERLGTTTMNANQLRAAREMWRTSSPAFESYHANRYWYFNVELLFATIGGVITGYAMLSAQFLAAPCVAVEVGGWLLVAAGAAEMIAAVALQPFSRRLDMFALLLIVSLSTLSELLAAATPPPRDGDNAEDIDAAVLLALLASIAEALLFVMEVAGSLCAPGDLAAVLSDALQGSFQRCDRVSACGTTLTSKMWDLRFAQRRTRSHPKGAPIEPVLTNVRNNIIQRQQSPQSDATRNLEVLIQMVCAQAAAGCR